MTVSYLPTRAERAAARVTEIAVDLSGLGATQRNDLVPELPAAPADLLRLAAYARSARRSGLSFTTLGPEFQLQPAGPHEGELDSLVAARRISSAAAGDLVPSLPASTSARTVISEIEKFSRKHGGPAGLQLELEDEPAGAADLVAAVRSATGPRAPQIIVPVRSEAQVAIAGQLADTVRLAEPDLVWARELRYAVRAAALAAGRTPVPVLVDVRTVIAEDPISARVRHELVEHLEPATGPTPLSVVGTAEEATDTLARWLEAGAADGFIIRPGSLPTDVAAVVREVIPALRERGFTIGHDAEDETAAATASQRPLVGAAG